MPLPARWPPRCRELIGAEGQEVAQAPLRLALLIAAPDNRIFLVGDDDQSIYGWRLADVRRILGLEAVLPGLRRVDLEVNYRCPRLVVERAVRLVEGNRERFAKAIQAGPAALAKGARDQRCWGKSDEVACCRPQEWRETADRPGKYRQSHRTFGQIGDDCRPPPRRAP